MKESTSPRFQAATWVASTWRICDSSSGVGRWAEARLARSSLLAIRRAGAGAPKGACCVGAAKRLAPNARLRIAGSLTRVRIKTPWKPRGLLGHAGSESRAALYCEDGEAYRMDGRDSRGWATGTVVLLSATDRKAILCMVANANRGLHLRVLPGIGDSVRRALLAGRAAEDSRRAAFSGMGAGCRAHS